MMFMLRFCFLVALLSLCCVGKGVEQLRQGERDLAMLVSTKPYHYEVLAFLAVHFERMNLKTMAYIKKGFQPKKEQVYKFLRNMTSTGHNLDYSYSIRGLDLPRKVKVLVIISADEYSDLWELCQKEVFEMMYSRAEKVLMLMHTAVYATKLAKVCKAPKCSVVVLHEHVRKAALSILSSASDDIKGSLDLQTISYIINFPSAYLNLRSIKAQQGESFVFVLPGLDPNSLVKIPPHLSDYIEMKRDPNTYDFYSLTASAHFILSFINSGIMGYSTYRITSTIPTALSTFTPMVLPDSILSLYPCLHSSPVHRQISFSNDCDSFQAALQLSNAEYAVMMQEVQVCHRKLWDEAHGKLRQLVFPASQNSGSHIFTNTFVKEAVENKEQCPSIHLNL